VSASRIAGAFIAAAGSVLLAATPALADPGSGGGVTSADNWNFTAPEVCAQELAVVPALSDWTGDHANNCSNGNVIDPNG